MFSKTTYVHLIALLILSLSVLSCQKSETIYVCPPCSCKAHQLNQTFDGDGDCPHCGMDLIESSDHVSTDDIEIKTGTGNFLIKGGPGHTDDTLSVFYHKATGFTSDSPILLVIPGAGRNGSDYRDAWISSAEQHNLLVLSPMYPENDYAFKDYHMGGVIDSTNALEQATFAENSNVVSLEEQGLTVTTNRNQKEWIYIDFDRIFQLAAKAVGSNQDHYDAFGHSAGGQILHRMVLFQPGTAADQVLASNSGFYTLPVFDTRLPFGLKQTPVTSNSLKRSLRQSLVLFLGELDNQHETGGLLLRSPTVDRQGTHRLERGRFFYRRAKTVADSLDAEFNWKLEVIPNIGHNYEKMSEAAADYLYGS